MTAALAYATLCALLFGIAGLVGCAVIAGVLVRFCERGEG